MAMVLQQEDQRLICTSTNNNSAASGGAKPSKKSKQKKIPQRGLGVAQLEEMRIKEQQKMSDQQKITSSCLALPQTQQPPSLPFLTAADHTRSAPSLPSNAANFFNPNPAMHLESPVCAGNSADRGFFTMLCAKPCAVPEAAVSRYNILASLQSVPFSRQHPQQQRFFMQTSKQLPPQSSSGVNLQIEPPSNQSYYSTNYHHIPPQEDDKVVGVKRPWPFHHDSLSGHGAFHCRVPAFREASASSSNNHADFRGHNHRSKSDCVATDDGFLTLAPYFPSSPGSAAEGLSQSAISSELPFYSFLPMGPDIHETSSNERHGDTSESVDLNLKL